MRCLYFSEEPIKICKAFLEGIKMPSKKEIKEYCLSENYKNCIFYQKKEKEIWESEDGNGSTPIKL